MSLRLERFELRAFGPFTATALELRGAPGGDLHIICGPNEAGKSTARRGIGDFLFGIPPRSTDNQVHDHGSLRLAAALLDEHGRRHELVRRKGTRRTLLGRDGEPVDPGLLEGMLGGMTREVFESMFSITHESLLVGGKALLAADGNLGESLFSASLGATGLHELRAELDQAASRLFKPRATSSLLLQVRAAFDAAKAELRGSTLRATEFTEHERELESARVEHEQLTGQIRQARTEQSARDRLRKVIPLLAERDQAQRELSSLAGAAELPADSRDGRLRATERAAADRQSAAGAQARVEDLKARIDALRPDAAVLERELAIKGLHGRLANVREGAEDLERQRVKLEAARGLAARALDQVRPDLQLQSADRLRLTNAQRARVENALERHAQLTALLQDAEHAAAQAQDHACGLAADLDARDPPPDMAALAAALGDAQASGQIEQRIADARAELAESIDLLSRELGQLDPEAGVERLRELRPPSAVAVERFAQEREQLDVRTRDFADRRDQLDSGRRELEQERLRLELTTHVPSIEDLGTAREERDGEWRRLRRALDGAADEPASSDAFEGHMRHADDVADRLRTEADSVARRAQLTARERGLESAREDLAERQQGLVRDRDEHDRRWAGAWMSTMLTPASPREMAQWLRVRQAIAERDDAVARHRRGLEQEQHARDRLHDTLRALVGARSQDSANLSTLSALVSVAQTRVAKAQAAREEYDQLHRDLRAARAVAGRQREKTSEHHAALERWHQEWVRIVAANGWPADVDADGARRVLATVNDLVTQLHEARQLDTRVNGIQERLDKFAADAAKLIEAVAPELQGRPAQDAAAGLQRRLDRATQTRSSRETLEGELAGAREELQAARRSVEQAERSLASLVELARVGTVDELPEAERRSTRAAELRARLPELEREITEAGQATLRELIDRAHGVDVDALDAQSAQGEERIAALEGQRDQLGMRIGELGREQQELERLGGAAGAAENLERCVAQLREHTERYLHRHLAGWALSEAIDAYRREHKDPLLERADELFPKLTCKRPAAGGAAWEECFQGLEVSFGADDEPVLEGVRVSGEELPVKLMTDGTREQLYLALRLASLERHVELHGPMPVILDDVVLRSDPLRKAAILRALADLGRRTQVIAFTHDPQLVALAQNAVDPDLLTVHELGGNEISGVLSPQIATADIRPIRPAKAA